MTSSTMVCKAFNPQSRIIQLIHMWASCISLEPQNYICRCIAAEFSDCPSDGSFTDILEWVHFTYPEAYPYVTGVIGFSGSWITTVAEAKELVLQQPYLYQGRCQFLDELYNTHTHTLHTTHL